MNVFEVQSTQPGVEVGGYLQQIGGVDVITAADCVDPRSGQWIKKSNEFFDLKCGREETLDVVSIA